jgi:hypothetical protein
MGSLTRGLLERVTIACWVAWLHALWVALPASGPNNDKQYILPVSTSS